MALSREERKSIEQLIKRVRDLEVVNQQQHRTIESLLLMVENIASTTNMSDWNSEQWEKFLAPYILKYSSKSSQLPTHNHTSQSQGGPCFAKLGANLINGEE